MATLHARYIQMTVVKVTTNDKGQIRVAFTGQTGDTRIGWAMPADGGYTHIDRLATWQARRTDQNAPAVYSTTVFASSEEAARHDVASTAAAEQARYDASQVAARELRDWDRY